MTTTLPQRKKLRLKDYDYSSQGLYSVTICTQDKQCLFGNIVNQIMQLNEYGEIVYNEWLKTSVLRPNVKLDEFVIMPNHIHSVINITGKTDGRGVLQYAPTGRFRSPTQTIGSIIRGFKSTTTKQINILRKIPFLAVWQRNYYEHIIRDDIELEKIREYIRDNPLNWGNDSENIK